jgi:hypothetical protein
MQGFSLGVVFYKIWILLGKTIFETKNCLAVKKKPELGVSHNTG